MQIPQALSTVNLMPVTPRPDVIFVRGEGAYLFDAQGRLNRPGNRGG